MATSRRFFKIAILAAILAFPMYDASADETGVKPQFSTELTLGYSSGFNVQASGMVSDFAQDFPLSARFAIGYSKVEPGDPAAARRIFINNATNGIPEKSGSQWDFRFDLLYPIHLLSMKRAYIYGGPRYTKFKANFKFIGGNEFFDVTSNLWGVGLGLETRYPMGKKVDLVFSGGVDYFPQSTITGHDTQYSPDGQSINPREDYTYDDANDAINQPTIEPRLVLGFAYRF